MIKKYFVIIPTSLQVFEVLVVGLGRAFKRPIFFIFNH